MKSPLESQKLRQSKVMCSGQSSLAHLSFKKGVAYNKYSGVLIFIICGIVFLISIKESQFELLYFCHVSAGI